MTTGTPTWTWPDWRKAPSGTRFRSNQSDRYGTFVRPSNCKNNGALVRWDGSDRDTYVVSPARSLTPVTVTAWGLIGFDGNANDVYDADIAAAIGPKHASVMPLGGRALYDAVMYNDGRTNRVTLARLDASGPRGLRQVSRNVDPDTQLLVVAVD